MEIEIPSSYLKIGTVIIFVLIFTSLGFVISPRTSEGAPIFLSPQRFQINQYVRNVEIWVVPLREIEIELSYLLQLESQDMFDTINQVNDLLIRVQRIQAEIDRSQAPASLESLYQLLEESSENHLEAALLVSEAVGEPTDENKNQAVAGLENAILTLDRVYSNPWLADAQEEDTAVAVPTLIPIQAPVETPDS